MRRILTVLMLCVWASGASAATVWSGFDFTFTKEPFADHTLAENQDRITDSVWLTRMTAQGLYNIQMEGSYQTAFSPADTEWAFSGLDGNPHDISAAGYAGLNFSDWMSSLGGAGQLAFNILDRPGVVHLISEDIYIDIMFTAWGQTPADGGNFAYMRGVAPIPVPAALPLLLSAFAVLGLARRRTSPA